MLRTAVLLALCLAGSLGFAARAETSAKAPAVAVAVPKAAVAPAPSVVPGPTQDQPVSTGVLGFRSARFGMDEAAVRAVIPKDLNVSADAIKASENLSQQTHVLTVRAPDVLPGGGAAEVAYVFGYKTKKLIQVGVVWSAATDPAITPERLFSNGNILRAHFQESGDYKPDTITTDAAVKNSLLMFRGSDADGHTSVLLLQGTMSAPADASAANKTKRVLTPKNLSLIYLSNAKDPDVFKLAPGQF